MSKEPPAFLIPASTIFVIAAVASAAAGGLVQGDGVRLLFGAGVIFCLSMLGVFLMFVHDLPRDLQGGLYTALGAVMGLCGGLFFAKEPVLPGLIGYVIGGTILGFFGYWTGSGAVRPTGGSRRQANAGPDSLGSFRASRWRLIRPRPAHLYSAASGVITVGRGTSRTPRLFRIR